MEFLHSSRGYKYTFIVYYIIEFCLNKHIILDLIILSETMSYTYLGFLVLC